MNERVAEGRMAFKDSSPCPDGFGTSTSPSNHQKDSVSKLVIAEKCFTDEKERVSQRTIQFRNNLPYEVFVEIIENDVVKIFKHVKAVDSTLLTTKINSIIIVHLNYLDKKWVFVRRVNILHNLQMCKFVSEDGEFIQLGLRCYLKKGMKIAFTVFSPVWITNDTDIELAYQQYHGVEKIPSAVKIYHPPKRGFHQPVLLSYDMKKLCVTCADRLEGRENWTRVPLNCFSSKTLELIANGKFRLVHSFVFPNSVVRGTTIFIRDRSSYRIPKPRKIILDPQVYQSDKNRSFSNDCPSGSAQNQESKHALPLTKINKTNCIAEDRLVFKDSSTSLDGSGTSTSTSNDQNDSLLERVIAEKNFRNEKYRVSQRTIKFQNNLSCEVFFDIIEDGVVEISQRVGVRDRIAFTTKNNSIIIAHFYHFGKKWVSFQRVNCLENSKMCEFISEDGGRIQLGTNCYIDNGTDMTFTVFSTTNNFVVVNSIFLF